MEGWQAKARTRADSRWTARRCKGFTMVRIVVLFMRSLSHQRYNKSMILMFYLNDPALVGGSACVKRQRKIKGFMRVVESRFQPQKPDSIKNLKKVVP